MHRYETGTSVEYNGYKGTIIKKYPSAYDDPEPMYKLKLNAGDTRLAKESELNILVVA
jgi:hypothetical protein